MKTILYVAVGFSLILFSCERKVIEQSSKVIISLPGNENQSLENIIDPLSTVSTYSEQDNGEDEFNSAIMPAFNSPTYPINCYLVGVGTTNAETAFSQNYCGKRSTVTGKIDKNYQFGPFIGLFSNTANVELEVPSGENRVIYVFGIHALNPAACLKLSAVEGQNPNPANFSRPFIVGKSSTFKVSPGQTSIVPITLTQPGTSDYIESCFFPSLNNEEAKPANKVLIERIGFPQNVLITAKNGQTNPTNIRCDYIDVVPKFSENTNDKNARVDSTKQMIVKMNGLQINSFKDKIDCEGNVNSVSTFPLFPSETRVRRWIPLTDAMSGSNVALEAQTSDGSLQSVSKNFLITAGVVPTATFTLNNTINNVQGGFDLILPKKIITGQCYEMFVTRKSLEGEPITHPAQASPFLLLSNPAGSISFFNAVNCTGGVFTGTNIPTSLNFRQVWFKINTPSTVEISVAANGGLISPHPIDSSIFKIQAITSSNTVVNSVEIEGPDILRRIGLAPFDCHPLVFRMKNEDKAVIQNSSLASSIELLLSQSEGDLSNISFWDNSTCTTTQVVGGSPINFGTGSDYKKIYIKTVAASGLGYKTIRFKVFDGAKSHFVKHQFEMINPNNP